MIVVFLVVLTWLTASALSRDAATTSGDPAVAAGSAGGVSTTTTGRPAGASPGSAAAAVVVRRGPTDVKRIALTFDDNYQGPNATRTLAVLEKYHVPATFFVIGHYVDLGPELAKAIAAGGFEVGDHTRSHCDCRTLSKTGCASRSATGPTITKR